MNYSFYAYIALALCGIILASNFFYEGDEGSPQSYASEVSSIFSSDVESKAYSVFSLQSSSLTPEVSGYFEQARSGDTVAMLKIGSVYFTSCQARRPSVAGQKLGKIDGLKYCQTEADFQRIQLGFKMIKAAAELENTEAQAFVGGIIYNRYLISKESRDANEAFYWLTKASEKGSSDAWLTLSGFYDLGGGAVAKDQKKSRNYLLKSAEAGNETAIKLLCYEDPECETEY